MRIAQLNRSFARYVQLFSVGFPISVNALSTSPECTPRVHIHTCLPLKVIIISIPSSIRLIDNSILACIHRPLALRPEPRIIVRLARYAWITDTNMVWKILSSFTVTYLTLLYSDKEARHHRCSSWWRLCRKPNLYRVNSVRSTNVRTQRPRLQAPSSVPQSQLR